VTSPDIALAVPARNGVGSRIVTFAVMLAALLAFLWIAEKVMEAGYVRRDIVALQSGDAWRHGGWLSQIVLTLVGLLPGEKLQDLVLSLTSAAAAGVAIGLLYHRLRATGWIAIGALLLVVALGSNALVLYSVTAASRSIPIFVALAALIPAIRALESVGDVQSAISLGLTMPLLLLAGPATAPLILPLAIASALADPDGRHDPRAFVAMILVAVLPSVIVGIGIVGFAAQAGLSVPAVLRSYVTGYATNGVGDWLRALVQLVSFAPVMLVPLAYCVLPSRREPKQIWSALAVVGLPFYLALASVAFPWGLPSWAPTVALLATFSIWLAAARLSLSLRLAALVLLLASLAISGTNGVFWRDPDWREGLIHAMTLH
jgi:hypothetical protein